MINREKAIKGLERFIADFKPFCGNKSDWQRVDDALALLKDSGQDEGWLCEKRTSGMQTTDLLCACGNKVYFTTLLFKDGFTANELYCPNCGLSMRSPHHDKDGVWLRKHWEEVVLKPQEPRVMTLEEVKSSVGNDMWRTIPKFVQVLPELRGKDGWASKGGVGMSDLISRAAAIGCLGNSPEQMCMPWSEMERMLRELPAVDAVPVVRCEECIYRHRETEFWKPCDEVRTPGTWFCADGKRREADDTP